MASAENLRITELSVISRQCAEQTELYFQRKTYDPRYCFELCRRALADRNDHAWECMYAQYCPFVAGWIKRHPAFPQCGDEVQHLVNCAFQKLWAALTPDKFAEFGSLASILRYLQMCVHSTIIDTVRGAEEAWDMDPEVSRDEEATPPDQVENLALASAQRRRFWQAIDERLQDDRERHVVYSSFVLGLKPRELCAEFPDRYQDVKEIYRIKENVLARLRRDKELVILLGDA